MGFFLGEEARWDILREKTLRWPSSLHLPFIAHPSPPTIPFSHFQELGGSELVVASDACEIVTDRWDDSLAERLRQAGMEDLHVLPLSLEEIYLLSQGKKRIDRSLGSPGPTRPSDA